MKGYKTIKDWTLDSKIMKRNPNDLKFLETVMSKVNATTPLLKEVIKQKIEDDVFAYNPIEFYRIARKRFDKKSFLIVKDLNDFWFQV